MEFNDLEMVRQLCLGKATIYPPRLLSESYIREIDSIFLHLVEHLSRTTGVQK